jgi:hypothetical protein
MDIMSWGPIYMCVEIKKQFALRGLEGRSIGIEISYVGLSFLDLFLISKEKPSYMINLELLLGNRHNPQHGI